jgi:hypothetical protein
LEGLWNGERRQRPLEPIALAIFDQDARFQHRLGKFLDKKWVAIGLGNDLFHHFGGQHAPTGYPRDHVFNVVVVETTERQGADVGETNPWRLKLRSEGEQCKDR